MEQEETQVSSHYPPSYWICSTKNPVFWPGFSLGVGAVDQGAVLLRCVSSSLCRTARFRYKTNTRHGIGHAIISP
jgi:hypothetical protein